MSRADGKESIASWWNKSTDELRAELEAETTPVHADDWLTVFGGDCRAVMATLPAGSVHCVVTCPPYWGLRDYGTATWDGGDAGCDHMELTHPHRDSSGGLGNVTTRGGQPYTAAATRAYRSTCGKCGAIRQDAQLGLEATPAEYVAAMVDDGSDDLILRDELLRAVLVALRDSP